MKLFWISLIFSLGNTISSLNATDSQYNSGQTLATQKQSTLTLPTPTANSVPGYGGTNLPQAQLNPSILRDQVERETSQLNNLHSFITDSLKDRPLFSIDPKTDPIFEQANKLVANPLKAISGEGILTQEPDQDITQDRTCEEPGSPVLHSCVEEQHVKVQMKYTISPTITSNFTNEYFTPCSSFSGNYCREAEKSLVQTLKELSDGAYYPFDAHPLVLEPIKGLDIKSINVDPYLSEKSKDRLKNATHSSVTRHIFRRDNKIENPIEIMIWVMTILSSPTGYTVYGDMTCHLFQIDKDVQKEVKHNCQDLEKKVDSGLCSYQELQTLEGPATRLINGHSVHQDWWRRRRIYECHYPSKDTCSSLKAQGCVQIGSTCKQYQGDICVSYAQTYRCVVGKKKGKTRISKGQVPYCLTGDCQEQGYAANPDMAEALSKLAIFKELSRDMNAEADILFRGSKGKCSRNCLNFKDCCGNGKGWGISLRLGECSDKEKILAQKRSENKCVHVGTYCAKKMPVTGICVTKKTSYCCFTTKLARIFQEQGRRQLGMGWGDPQSPNCLGFTVEQLTRIDFDKLDLKELFTDLLSKMKKTDLSKVTQHFQQDWSKRLPSAEEAKKGQPLSPQKIPPYNYNPSEQTKTTSGDQDVVF